MFRYSGPLISFVVIAVCLGINIVQYPVVWEMVDKTAFTIKIAREMEEIEEFATEDGQSEQQIAQAERRPTSEILQEGPPVSPPFGGSPSSSSTRTLYSTNLSKLPPENVSSSGYGPIPAHSVPNRIAGVTVTSAVEASEPQAELSVASDWTNEQEEEDKSDYQPAPPQQRYATRYEEPEPETDKTPPAQPLVESNGSQHEWTPEARVHAFRNSPLDLTPANDPDNEFRTRPDW